MSAVTPELPAPARAARASRTAFAPLRRLAGADGELIIGVTLLIALIAAIVLIPILSAYDVDTFVGAPMEAPSVHHLFGTDTLGRDMLVRVAAAGRLDLVIAFVGVLVPLLLGTSIGIAAGMARSRLADAFVVRLVDAIIAFPFIVLVLALAVLFGADRGLGPLPGGLPALFAAIFAVNWTVYTRLARAETLRLRQRDYIVAAHLFGFSRWRIVRRHVLPNVAAQAATYGVSDMILVLIVAASLPFLGAGVQPPSPEWGSMMFEGRTVLGNAWWITVFPGLAIMVFGLGVTLIADALIARGTRR